MTELLLNWARDNWLLAQKYWWVGLAYVAVSAIVFIRLRRTGSTDGRATELLGQPHRPAQTPKLRQAMVEFLRLNCARLLTVVTLLAIVVRLAVGQWNYWDLGIFVGVMAWWPVQEWVVHVMMLHRKPTTVFGKKVDVIIARNHRNHHRIPWDAKLGITPPHIIWLYIAGLPILWLAVFPTPQALTGIATFVALVWNYEWLHFLIHTTYKPRTWFYRRLWINHRLHHYKNENFWYGVTMLSGDWLMHTQPVPEQTDRSETCRTLGIESDLLPEQPLREENQGLESPAVEPDLQTLEK